MMSLADLIRKLDGAAFKKSPNPQWGGLCSGEVEIMNLKSKGGVTTFDLLVPTSELDANDYIWESELQAGSTNKVVLKQGGKALEKSRICAIAREKMPHRYRFTFEVEEKSVSGDRPLEVHCFWNEEVLAVAQGRSGFFFRLFQHKSE
jgi:hypothetical protein